jgi:hypothetical protein
LFVQNFKLRTEGKKEGKKQGTGTLKSHISKGLIYRMKMAYLTPPFACNLYEFDTKYTLKYIKLQTIFKREKSDKCICHYV